ncbi:hypothetical protein AB0J72_03860 [Dactylosporangium sp. NPDC049742]|uniref:hypothetical protein n=1 Tax=Dactylosporangium sp. NPDC049742 TaxID=3154737 RepID=UPI003419B787
MLTRSKVWLVATAVAVIGLAAGFGVRWLTRGPGTTTTPIASVATAAGNSPELEVSLTYSSCDALDHIDVAEDARTVTLTAHLRSRAPDSCGTVPTTTTSTPVPLKAPLDRRTVVDGATGSTIRTG